MCSRPVGLRTGSLGCRDSLCVSEPRRGAGRGLQRLRTMRMEIHMYSPFTYPVYIHVYIIYKWSCTGKICPPPLENREGGWPVPGRRPEARGSPGWKSQPTGRRRCSGMLQPNPRDQGTGANPSSPHPLLLRALCRSDEAPRPAEGGLPPWVLRLGPISPGHPFTEGTRGQGVLCLGKPAYNINRCKKLVRKVVSPSCFLSYLSIGV